MKSKKVLSLLLACAVTVSMGTTVFASTEDQIAAAQAQKQEAQAGLAQAQANIRRAGKARNRNWSPTLQN